MSLAAILFATLRFALWEAALFAFAIRLARLLGWRVLDVEGWLAALAIEVTLESSLAGLFSFTHTNSEAGYWIAAAVCAAAAWVRLPGRSPQPGGAGRNAAPLVAALLVPLVFLSFRPVEEIDSINYLHYLIDWMANRATPYVFATNYVAFWELSFLPAWMVTRVDLFFPLIALKGVLLAALAAWLVGRELGLGGRLLLWTVFGSLTLHHYWVRYSGIPTLKNDALHGAGFLLLALAIMRAARHKFEGRETALLAFGAAFASVKYTGVFFAAAAVALALWFRRREIRPLPVIAAGGFILLTSGHYYLHNFFLHGSPFYPFQINLGFIHLPGTADLSNTSILFSLRDPRLWRAFLLPSGISPAGLLFPVTLAAGLLMAAWRVAAPLRRGAAGIGPTFWLAFAILCGWFLYFRSVFSASASPGDLGFVLNGLNSLRYVDGVLAGTELFLVALLAGRERLALALVGINAASRLFLLYRELRPEVLPWVLGIAVLSGAALLGCRRLFSRPLALLAASALVLATPCLVQFNRRWWTTYWNDLKPTLQSLPGPELAELALPDGSYFAGHVVAAGNPVRPAVRALLPEQVDALAGRPRYLAVLLTPGMSPGWLSRYGPQLAAWGYAPALQGAHGVIFERRFR